MAAAISSLDLHYLVEEMQILSGSKVDRITQPGKEYVAFQFYVKGKGKKVLKIKLPSLMYLAEKKPETPEKLFGFCSALRKYLANSFLESIKQVGSERVAKLEFRTKEETFFVYAELFAKGNIILCREDNIIIVPLNTIKFKTMNIKAGAKYSPPVRESGFLQADAAEISRIMAESGQNISKTIAVELGLGGEYSREVCSAAGIDESVEEITESEAKKLAAAVKKLAQKKPKSFSASIEAMAESGIPKKQTKQQKELEKLQKIISTQEKTIKELESDSAENQKKGELIYEKYSMLNEVLEEIRKARKKYSWKDIREKLKGHKLVKDVNEKTGEIILDV